MKQILINDYFLTIEDMDFGVIRVKGLIVNSKNEVLLCHNNGTYQWPGGHKEDDETLEVTLLREIKDETGIEASLENGPFTQITTYDNDYFNTNRQVINKIYYYRVLTDDFPDIENTNLDELEMMTDFKMEYVKLNELDGFLHNCIDNGTIDKSIGREMLLVLKEYDRLFGGVE